ncbi:ergothioneine biosynthesis protein EgtB [Rubricoccus marinus]|uniref:Sulfatase maturase n=1 Tax=Rubricoccus marinus TaxID=716817 RepID=A0A259TYI4_9BACT|nr:ergothioneine biosynthesis protein EgtB [Rubricoccus marinus]OZC02677.1 hypothetical protein BSZ36_06630 [Rubricoccus marinus]
MPATLLETPEAVVCSSLSARFAAVRAQTEHLCDPLATEDYVVQAMEDVSPTKWHLAHTTWFWETFVLAEYAEGYELHDARYPFLFNSYYVQAGERHCRAQRGYLSRPTVQEVFAYRHAVTEAMQDFLAGFDERQRPDVADVIEIGLHHEQQHQELMLTDLKYVFSVNPLRPVYRSRPPEESADPGPLAWVEQAPGVTPIGFEAPEAETTRERFHFDNEAPRHRVYLEPFALADRLVTAGEMMYFVEDGGYARPEFWLSEGWATAQEEGWTCPFYWEPPGVNSGTWEHFTLAGMRPIDPHEPVTHVSFYEADAFARWADLSGFASGARLASEAEWEAASRTVWNGTTADGTAPGSYVDRGRLHPAPAPEAGWVAGGDGAPAAPALRQMFGEVWQWTESAYRPFPGYRAAPGALGEYNGKFMSNKMVLRGGSVATPQSHIRPTYRNFFPLDATWQFTGIRLAKSL